MMHDLAGRCAIAAAINSILWPAPGSWSTFAGHNCDEDQVPVQRIPPILAREPLACAGSAAATPLNELHRQNGTLFQQNKALLERIAELEGRAGKPQKTPTNSSLPPSSGHKANVSRAHRARRRAAKIAPAWRASSVRTPTSHATSLPSAATAVGTY